MQDDRTLAVFDVKSRNADGIESIVRVGFGPKRLWPNEIRKVHMSMFHAIAKARQFTHVRPTGGDGRWPTKRRRNHAAAVLGHDYKVNYIKDATESVGSYDGMSVNDAASDASEV
jgi:hypothetical protein